MTSQLKVFVVFKLMETKKRSIWWIWKGTSMTSREILLALQTAIRWTCSNSNKIMSIDVLYKQFSCIKESFVTLVIVKVAIFDLLRLDPFRDVSHLIFSLLLILLCDIFHVLQGCWISHVLIHSTYTVPINIRECRSSCYNNWKWLRLTKMNMLVCWFSLPIASLLRECYRTMQGLLGTSYI